jgi:2-dehydro-3-deoxyphosphogluconate aldolase/(4S)-4-hydroxy-2-oxoglutarate aldolase
MHEALKRLGDVGVLPAIVIDDASRADALGKALLAGGLPVAEITFRTAAAEEAIRILHRTSPDLLVGAGTVLTTDQVDRAVEAGAQFIVAPGFNPRVVDHCIQLNVPVAPGISSASEIEMGLERGIEVLKFFPAEASGGLDFLAAIAAPFRDVLFIPMGGIDPGNLRQYLLFPRVLAVGGTWIAKGATLSAGRFDEITRLAREAVTIALGFELAHVGINEDSPERAMSAARMMGELFCLDPNGGNSSTFVGSGFEFPMSPGLGTHGHLALSTLSIPRAVAYLSRKGVSIRKDTIKQKDGRIASVYLDREVSGFAIHLLQR